MTQYVYQTHENLIQGLYPEDLNYLDFGDLPEGWGWYLSDKDNIPYGTRVLDDGSIEQPEPPPKPSALLTPMTYHERWAEIVAAMNRIDPALSAVLQFLAAKIEQNNDVAESALNTIEKSL